MPVTIGSQTDVPDTGDPIVSPWYQDTSRKLVHTFASTTARDAWSTPPDGALCVTVNTNQLWMRQDTVWVEIPALDDTDARYVNVAGDTMTGRIVVGLDPAPPTSGQAGVGIETSGIIRSAYFTDASPNLVLRRYGSAINTGDYYMNFFRLTAEIGSIKMASSSSVSFNTTSDPRLKEQTGDAGDALGAVAELGAKVYRGRWIADEGQGEEWLFLNSTDVEAVAPYAVAGDADAVDADGGIVPQQLDHSALVPLLMAAVAQLAGRVAALETGEPF